MIKEIEFAYVVGLARDEAREVSMRNAINMWLQQVTNEVNEQGGIVFVLFISPHRQEVFIDGIGFNLKKKVLEQINSFRTFEH